MFLYCLVLKFFNVFVNTYFNEAIPLTFVWLLKYTLTKAYNKISIELGITFINIFVKHFCASISAFDDHFEKLVK